MYEYNPEWERGGVGGAVMASPVVVVDTYEGILCTVLSAPPPPPPDDEEEEGKFPWLLVGIGGAVAIVGLLAVTTKGGK